LDISLRKQKRTEREFHTLFLQAPQLLLSNERFEFGRQPGVYVVVVAVVVVAVVVVNVILVNVVRVRLSVSVSVEI
jgi:hypothetical protein